MYSFEIEKRKSELKSRVRSFFNKHLFIEVDTPLLSPTTIPEHSISLFSTIKEGEFTKKEKLFLLPSPELYMKKLICKYHASIYQISKAFRNAEQTSPIHQNEFTMLEYYKINASYTDTIALTESLIKEVFFDSKDTDLLKEVKIISIDELLRKHTSYSLKEIHNIDCRKDIAEKFSLNLPANESFDDTFNRIFLHIIEPEIAKINSPLFAIDYPIEIECLAKEKDEFTRERFELYFKGVELANGYGEMCDNSKIKALFATEKGKIPKGQIIDTELQTLTMPKTSGVAIGFDRLIMASEKIGNITDINFQ